MAKGFTQQNGLDYFETFSLVAKFVTVKTLLALVVVQQWHIIQLDMNNAFRHEDLYEEVNLKLPLGYHPLVTNKGKVQICKLNRSLCGLKQASKQWFAKFTNVIIAQGFK